jgi:hypothetical protein
MVFANPEVISGLSPEGALFGSGRLSSLNQSAESDFVFREALVRRS